LREPGNQRLLVTAILTIVYAGVMVGRVPYPLATGLFVFFFVLVFERTPNMTRAKWVRCLLAAFILAVVTATAVSVAFERLFLVTLP
jgi:putative tricarboxylic transport membrane protein